MIAGGCMYLSERTTSGTATVTMLALLILAAPFTKQVEAVSRQSAIECLLNLLISSPQRRDVRQKAPHHISISLFFSSFPLLPSHVSYFSIECPRCLPLLYPSIIPPSNPLPHDTSFIPFLMFWALASPRGEANH